MKRLLTLRALVALVLLAGIATGGAVWYQRRGATAVSYRTAAAAMGTITQTLDLTGNLTPVGETDLDFSTAGRVTEVDVTAGQQVTQGQVLARLDAAALQGALTQAQAGLQSAQAKLSLDQAGPTAAALASARNQVTSATLGLQNAKTSLADSEAINAQSVTAAQQAITGDQSTVGADQTVVTSDQSKQQGDQQQETTDCNASSTSSACQQDRQTVASDNQRLAGDEQTLTRDQATLAGAQSSLQALLLKVQQSNDQAAGQEASAQAALNSAEESLTALEQGTTSQQIAMDQAQVATAQVGVDTANRNLQGAVLTAPVGGTVGSVTLAVGQSVSGGASSSSSSSSSSATHAIAVIVPGAFQVTGTVSDSQVGQIAVGQRARVVVAGAQNASDGRVTAISPEAMVTSGVASFSVTVLLTGNDPTLHAGSSATVSVIVDQVVHVLSVPTGAVHSTGGASVVQVLKDGIAQSVPVTIGAQDATRTQVVSGLSEGDQVIIATVGATVPTTTGSGANGLFGGGAGGGTRALTGGGGGGARAGG